MQSGILTRSIRYIVELERGNTSKMGGKISRERGYLAIFRSPWDAHLLYARIAL